MAGSKRPPASLENHLAAVRFATSNLERAVVHRLIRTPAERRPEAFYCVMELYVKLADNLDRCMPLPPPDPNDPQGPDCPKGWIPVGDDCIPEPSGGG